ncbi:MAG: LuxR C-terminal-related transcriptional regulator [Polyangiaceae bacterium]
MQGVRATRFTVGGEDIALFEVPPERRLTEAEVVVVRAAVRGQRNKQIAEARGTSERTVAHQLASAYQKLGVQSRAELAVNSPLVDSRVEQQAPPAADPVGLIEAAYRQTADTDLWLSGVAAAATGVLGAQMGVTAYLFEHSETTGLHMGDPIGVACMDGWHEAFRALFNGAPNVSPALMRALRQPISVASEATGGPILETMSGAIGRIHALGIRDFLRLVAEAPGGYGCVLNVPLMRTGSSSSYDQSLLRRLLAHIGAGFRLRRHLIDARAAGTTLESLAAAILDAGTGRVLHAASDEAKEKSSREALTQRARTLGKVRGRLRVENPPLAVELWRGLVQGRWALVEQFDRDGKRFLFAHARPRPGPSTLAASLTDRESEVVSYAALGHSNKLIAYELGLNESTVGMRLSRACRKLGVRSRVELIQRIQSSRPS